mmetsp:Transcript_24666/g.46772  ORF Transcript_24666/g.46772 Transcript_24666/m.46772 type:complete len:265 (-) Transcript_24666:402-1196(-)
MQWRTVGSQLASFVVVLKSIHEFPPAERFVALLLGQCGRPQLHRCGASCDACSLRSLPVVLGERGCGGVQVPQGRLRLRFESRQLARLRNGWDRRQPFFNRHERAFRVALAYEALNRLQAYIGALHPTTRLPSASLQTSLHVRFARGGWGCILRWLGAQINPPLSAVNVAARRRRLPRRTRSLLPRRQGSLLLCPVPLPGRVGLLVSVIVVVVGVDIQASSGRSLLQHGEHGPERAVAQVKRERGRGELLLVVVRALQRPCGAG